MTKIAFVLPWYDESAGGGFQSAARDFARALSAEGHDVEIVTTCARNGSGDGQRQDCATGISDVEGVRVRRFPVDFRNPKSFEVINTKAKNRLIVAYSEETIFFEESLRSSELTEFCKKNASQYVFLPMPYMAGTSLDVARACPESTVMIPRLRNEPYVQYPTFWKTFAKIRGAAFLAPSELSLKQQIHTLSSHTRVDRYIGLGAGEAGPSDAPVKSLGLPESPYLVYMGSKDFADSMETLFDFFGQFKAARPDIALNLVLAGPGHCKIPVGLEKFVFDLGTSAAGLRPTLFKNALSLVQPALEDPFSTHIAEAWKAGCPSLVHKSNKVALAHVLASSGGLFFTNACDFEQVLLWMLKHAEQRKNMVRLGRAYTDANFSWTVTAQNCTRFLRDLGFEVA